MYAVGDYVVYGSHGVCRIVAEEDRRIDRKVIAYFSLEPLGQPGAVYYVPSKNPAALAKLRPLIEKHELEKLLCSDQVRNCCWIDDENRRKLRYRELIARGDLIELVSMVHALHLHKQELMSIGKRVHQCDEVFLHDAEKNLTAEFALVLEIDPLDVPVYISAALQKQDNWTVT